MNDQINSILKLRDGAGRFRSGPHRFSWTTGLAHARRRTLYQQAFDHNPPAWVKKLHPAKAAHLYKLALDAGTKLPQTLDR